MSSDRTIVRVHHRTSTPHGGRSPAWTLTDSPAFHAARPRAAGVTSGNLILVGAAHLQLVSVQLRPDDAMFEATVRGWRAQPAARGLREDSIGAR
jgi:hypothetical protein